MRGWRVVGLGLGAVAAAGVALWFRTQASKSAALGTPAAITAAPQTAASPVLHKAVAATPTARQAFTTDIAGIRIDPRFPLAQREERKTPYATHTTYEVRFEGVPLWPPQQVVVHKDRDGKTLQVQSNYSPPQTPDNPVRWSADQVLTQIREELKSQGEGGPAPALIGSENVSPVLWIQDRVQGSPSRRAYSVYMGGRVLVVDATTGLVLTGRDMRQH